MGDERAQNAPMQGVSGKGFWRRQYGRRGILKMALLLAVTVAVFASLLWRVDAREVLSTLAASNVSLLLAALVLGALVPVAGSLRWYLMLKAAGERTDYVTCFRVFYAALPANVLTPSHAGDLLRSVFMRHRVEPWKGTGVILAERVVDVAVLACLALAGALAHGQHAVAWAAAAVLLLEAGVCVVAFLCRRIPLGAWLSERSERLFSGLKSVAARPSWLLAATGASALVWGMNLAVTFMCFAALGADVSPVQVVASMPMAIFAGLLPVTLMGMGTRDSAIVLLFADVAPRATCLGVGLLYSLLLYWAIALWGLPFLGSVLRDRRLAEARQGPASG